MFDYISLATVTKSEGVLPELKGVGRTEVR